MNKVILIGRCTRDPEVRYSQGENATAVARYTLAVDRQFKRDGDQSADFINCIAFGKRGEFAEKYLRKGTKIAVVGRIQTGSYTNKDGNKVYTTDVVVDEHEFVESKATIFWNALGSLLCENFHISLPLSLLSKQIPAHLPSDPAQNPRIRAGHIYNLRKGN